ncbi:MAG: hypothetical protein IJX57_01365 [Clostridia bacterium]|nr:hypothetical protein [Clostridia bacterium]
MANKNDNKSLFMYTALIFFVAVVLIILSFFGQTNLQKNQPEIEQNKEQTQTVSGITEKAAILSEENKVLLEQNKALTTENETLQAENEALVKKQNTNDILLSSYGYYTLGNNAKALELLKTVNYEELSADQKIIYDKLNNNLQ